MKKYILLLLIIAQATLLFSQEWSSWTTIPNSSISFSAKSSGFDNYNNMYAWDVKFKTNKTPVYFEFKIKDGYFSGSSEVNKYFSTVIFDSRDNENRSNGSGGKVYSNSNVLTISIRNVCFDFGQDRNPKCQKSDNEGYSSSTSGQSSSTKMSQTEAINQVSGAITDIEKILKKPNRKKE